MEGRGDVISPLAIAALAITALAAEPLALTGLGEQDATGTTYTFTAQPSSTDTRNAAWRHGTYGHTAWGIYWQLDLEGGGGHYIWFTMDGAGVDPGTYVAGLAGYTGHQCDMTGPTITASARAALVRALSISGITIGGSGATASFTGALSGASVGGMWGGSEFGAGGTRRNTAAFATNDLNGRISQSWTHGGGTVVPTALGMYRDDTSAACRLALYSGGTAGAGGHTAAALVTEVLIAAGGATGWVFVEVPADEVATIANGAVLRLVAKSNSTMEPGYIGIGDLTGTDFANNLEVFDTMSTDPTVAFPATLAAETADTSNAVYALMAVQYRSTDGTSAIYTTRWGIQDSVAVGDLAQTSSLTVPDALGAELYMGAAPPPLLGMELHRHGIAHGTAWGSQMRAFVAQGGISGDASGATILWQAQTSGSATAAWVEVTPAGTVAVDDSDRLWWGVKNDDAAANFRFALNANRETAVPDDDPGDFVDASEYEIFATATGDGTPPAVYDTDPANAIVSPVDPGTAATATNANYPGAYLILRVPADTVA